MLIKTIAILALVASTLAVPVENASPADSQDNSKVVNDIPVEQQPEVVPPQEIPNKSEDLPPPIEEPNPLLIEGPVPINPNSPTNAGEAPVDQPPSDEKTDLDTANTFGFGYGGWGYRPYYGYGGWRRGWGFGGYGGIGYGLGFYGRAYSPWGWRGYYYY